MHKYLLISMCLAFSGAHAQIPSQATAQLFESIEKADIDLFNNALLKEVDVNARNFNTGCTPLMSAIAKSIDMKMEISTLHSITAGFSLFSGILGFAASAAGLIALTHSRTIFPSLFVVLAGATVGGIGTGILSYKLFEKLLSLKHAEKQDQDLETMIYILCARPDINFEIKHDLTGKNVALIIAEIINPRMQVHATTTYHHHHVGDSYSYSRPSINYHTNATFHVLNKPYSVSENFHANTIKPFFEKLARYLYHEKGLVIPYAIN